MNRPGQQPDATTRRTAVALVVEALLDELPDFLWDDQDINDCAHTAVAALIAAGWQPGPLTNDEEKGV